MRIKVNFTKEIDMQNHVWLNAHVTVEVADNDDIVSPDVFIEGDMVAHALIGGCYDTVSKQFDGPNAACSAERWAVGIVADIQAQYAAWCDKWWEGLPEGWEHECVDIDKSNVLFSTYVNVTPTLIDNLNQLREHIAVALPAGEATVGTCLFALHNTEDIMFLKITPSKGVEVVPLEHALIAVLERAGILLNATELHNLVESLTKGHTKGDQQC